MSSLKAVSFFTSVVALVVCFASASQNTESNKFLEENAKKEGVITLPSGLQYKARPFTHFKSQLFC